MNTSMIISKSNHYHWSFTGCSFKIVFFLKMLFFLNSASFVASLVFYLPGVCTDTDNEGKPREARVRNILSYIRKNTIFNEHPVCFCFKNDPLSNIIVPVACIIFLSHLTVRAENRERIIKDGIAKG